jgi:hypothetical protein
MDDLDLFCKAVADCMRLAPLCLALICRLEEQFNECVRDLKRQSPVPGDRSSPQITERFTTLADVTTRIVRAVKSPPSEAIQEIVSFFTYYQFPVNLAPINFGTEDTFLDDPKLFLAKVMEDDTMAMRLERIPSAIDA